jgi:hypothetical protein
MEAYRGINQRTGNLILLASLGRTSEERVLNGGTAGGALAVCVCDAAVGARESGYEAGNLLVLVLVADGQLRCADAGLRTCGAASLRLPRSHRISK